MSTMIWGFAIYVAILMHSCTVKESADRIVEAVKQQCPQKEER